MIIDRIISDNTLILHERPLQRLYGKVLSHSKINHYFKLFKNSFKIMINFYDNYYFIVF